MLARLDSQSPRGAARLQGRVVVVVRSGYFREVGGDPWVQHEIEMFVKIDSRGWKAVATTLRPVIEKVLDDQVQEAGMFVSLMARLVEAYPDWAADVARNAEAVSPESREGFPDLVAQTRRPGAFTGRPVVADSQTRKASAFGARRR
jgi:hypothetical protein